MNHHPHGDVRTFEGGGHLLKLSEEALSENGDFSSSSQEAQAFVAIVIEFNE